VEIRHLRYFIAVAEQLSFSKAAQALHMSQPPLSKRISDLEAELGVRLFDRTHKRIEMTAVGLALLPHARLAVQAFDEAARAATVLLPSGARKLKIALPPETSRYVILDIVNRLSRERIEISIIEASTAEQCQLLEAAEIDLGVVRQPCVVRGLRSSYTLRQELGVLLHSAHPLATRATITLSSLQSFPLVMFPRASSPGLYDDLLRLCRVGGYTPERILHGVRMTAALLITESAVTLTTERILRRRLHGGLRELEWKKLEGEPIHWRTSTMRRSFDHDPLTALAEQVVVDALQNHEQWALEPQRG
jgi:DNA-binding transcriptional LysR family regulator